LSKPFHDFRLKNPGAHGKTAEVWLDEQKLRGVTNVDVHASATDATRITITFIAGTLNDETELLELLKKEV